MICSQYRITFGGVELLAYGDDMQDELVAGAVQATQVTEIIRSTTPFIAARDNWLTTIQWSRILTFPNETSPSVGEGRKALFEALPGGPSLPSGKQAAQVTVFDADGSSELVVSYTEAMMQASQPVVFGDSFRILFRYSMACGEGSYF